MALAFNDVNGSAKTTKIDYFKFEDGDNEFRMVGGVLPRYVYWNKTPKNTAIALECLSFNRETETFDNAVKDWHQHYFPDIKCKWSYVVQAYDKNGKLRVVSLRKQMFESIIQNAHKHWGDPTDPETGMKIVILKKKTGPQAFNVAYEVDVMSCIQQPLTDEQKKELEEKPSIDELFPRQSADELHENIKRVWFSEQQEKPESENLDEDIAF